MGVNDTQLSGYRIDLLRYVDRRVNDAALSEDIVQEAFLRLLTYEAKAENTILNVTALLRRISLNLTRDHFRHSRRLAIIELSDELPCQQLSAHQQIEHKQLISIVADILQAMPPLRREVFIRRRVYGHSACDHTRRRE